MIRATNNTVCIFLFLLIVAGIFTYMYLPYWFRTSDSSKPVNFVTFDGNLNTSGQPSITQLQRLSDEGYELVINLAPPDSYVSIHDEAYYIASSGVTYINLPVSWEKPAQNDFKQFSALLKIHRDKKVLVHCQANYRASSFVFLYRVIQEQADFEQTYQILQSVWQPDNTWESFIKTELTQAGLPVDFF